MDHPRRGTGGEAPRGPDALPGPHGAGRSGPATAPTGPRNPGRRPGHPAPTVDPRRKPSHRRRTAWLAATVVVALAAIGVALYVVNGTGHRNTPPGAQRPASTTQTTPGAADGQPSYKRMVAVVSEFYGLLPQHQAEAYTMLSASYRKTHTFRQFEVFYNTITTVVPSGFQQLGANTVQAVLTFTTNMGRVTHEPYRFTIRTSPTTGALQIDNAVAVRTAGM